MPVNRCVLLLVAWTLALSGCHRALLDPDTAPLPKVLTVNPVEVGALDRVSKFRSGVGHDYSDGVETCRSMKHYLVPRGGPPGRAHDPPWTDLEVRAPAKGVVVGLEPETFRGMQLSLRPAAEPALRIILFHVQPEPWVRVGSKVAAGQRLGTHGSDDTAIDVAVEVTTPTGKRLVSYFEVLSPAAFSEWAREGAASPDAFIISRAERDAAPLTCAGKSFTPPREEWVELP